MDNDFCDWCERKGRYWVDGEHTPFLCEECAKEYFAEALTTSESGGGDNE